MNNADYRNDVSPSAYFPSLPITHEKNYSNKIDYKRDSKSPKHGKAIFKSDKMNQIDYFNNEKLFKSQA
jgi:hypothetical protein